MWQLEKNMKMFHLFLINSVGNHVEISIAQRVKKKLKKNLTGLTPPRFCVCPKPRLVVLSGVQLR